MKLFFDEGEELERSSDREEGEEQQEEGALKQAIKEVVLRSMRLNNLSPDDGRDERTMNRIYQILEEQNGDDKWGKLNDNWESSQMRQDGQSQYSSSEMVAEDEESPKKRPSAADSSSLYDEQTACVSSRLRSRKLQILEPVVQQVKKQPTRRKQAPARRKQRQTKSKFSHGRSVAHPEMERQLVDWVNKKMDKHEALAFNQRQIREKAQQLLRKVDKNTQFAGSKGWMEKFLHRNRELDNRILERRERRMILEQSDESDSEVLIQFEGLNMNPRQGR